MVATLLVKLRQHMLTPRDSPEMPRCCSLHSPKSADNSTEPILSMICANRIERFFNRLKNAWRQRLEKSAPSRTTLSYRRNSQLSPSNTPLWSFSISSNTERAVKANSAKSILPSLFQSINGVKPVPLAA